MRSGAALLLLGAVALGVTGCTGTSTGAGVTRTATASATPTSTAGVTADRAFQTPVVCHSVVDYETVQAAIAKGAIAEVRTVAAEAATDAAAGLAADRAHTWSPQAAALVEPYLAKVADQVAYFRLVAKAGSIDAATALQWPDGTAESTPLFAAIGLTGRLTCPAP